jgi:hypothetical protein
MSFHGASKGWLAVAAVACALGGCVNRGMQALEPDARDTTIDRNGSGGAKMDAGADNRAGPGGNGVGGSGFDASSDLPQDGVGVGVGGGGRGAGGTGGSGAGGRGTGGSAGTGAGGSPRDAGAVDGPRVCSARFNFENGDRYGAFINTGYQTAFTNLTTSSDAACGAGSLRLDSTVTPTANKGEVIIPFAAAEDVSGKTVSIWVKPVPAAPPDAYVIVFLVPSYTFVTSFIPIPSVWTSSTIVLPGGADAGTRGTTGLAVQLLGGGDSFTGALYLDEIDVR